MKSFEELYKKVIHKGKWTISLKERPKAGGTIRNQFYLWRNRPVNQEKFPRVNDITVSVTKTEVVFTDTKGMRSFERVIQDSF